MPPPIHREVVEIKKVSGHVDFFLAELQAEVNELRARQRDYLALQEQYRCLNEDFNRVLVDKTNFENDCMARISGDRKEVDLLISEFETLKTENAVVE